MGMHPLWGTVNQSDEPNYATIQPKSVAWLAPLTANVFNM